MKPCIHCRAAVCLALLLAALHLLSGHPARAQLFEAVTLASPATDGSTQGALALTDSQHLLSTPTVTNSAFLLGLARNPLTQQLIAVATSNAGPQLAYVDFQAGTATPFGPTLPGSIRSLAFDSHGNLFGFSLCDPTYPNELFSLDPVGGGVIAILGSLDSGRVAPCTASNSLTLGGVIAIDQSSDTLYFSSVDASGDLFVDRLDAFLVPTLVYTNTLYAPVIFLLPVMPLSATFADGRLWVPLGGSFFGPGFGMLNFDPAQPAQAEVSGGAQYRALSFSNNAPLLGLVEASPPCVPSATAVCLFNRFQVAATYDATPDNGSGDATVLLESTQTVKFSFFDPANVELILKMVDACAPPFNHWWVSGGGLTNVGVQIRVTDTSTHQVKTYASSKGQLFQTFFDTAAFPCP